MSVESLVQSLQKAELHIHIEGSIEPELMFKLAGRNNVEFPYESVTDLRAAYEFSNLQDFLDLYYDGINVLREEQDFFDMTCEYLDRAKADNVNHVELFFDPQAHTDRGISLDTVMQGLSRAIREKEDKNFKVRPIMCLLRHLSESEAFGALELAEPYRDTILGVGLDSSEVGHPPSKFRNVFEEARKQGYRLVAHAGEEGPPEYIWEALDVLGVERLDHGNRALEDSTLMKRLEREKIPLTMCPLSNLKLCVVDTLKEHPLRRMLDAGIVATINSDDPAYFGGYINENYVAVAKALNLSESELGKLATNSQIARFN